MAIKKIVKIWDDGKISNSNIEFLKLKTKKVTFPLSPFINQIIQDLIDTYETIACAGIAANQIGYEVEIVQVETNDRILNAVRIIRYSSKTAAEKIGQIVKRKLGVDYRVLYRPTND